MEGLFLFPTSISSKLNILETSEKIPDNIKIIRANEMWEKSKKGKGVVVAVIDTGCDVNHPDLQDAIVGGYNFTDDDNGNPDIYHDYNGHGTHVAGIIAARANEKGIIGVAPEAQLLILKVLNSKGTGNISSLAHAINYATNWEGKNGEKVSIINMSLGGTQDDDMLRKTIKKAKQQGILLVGAAGNLGDNKRETSEVMFPSFYEEVIQVGAINENFQISHFSNSNVNIDFVAPGDQIYSTYKDKGYIVMSGTSMAAPHLSGALALVHNIIGVKDQVLTPFLTQTYILKHAKSLGCSVNEEGNGLIQLK
jgi:major intracellular serine protease